MIVQINTGMTDAEKTAAINSNNAFLNALAAHTESIGASGYAVLAGGLVVQWGRAAETYGSDTYLGPPGNYEYPMEFPNAALTMIAESSRPYLYNSTYGVLRPGIHYAGGATEDGKKYFNLNADHANTYVKAGTYSLGWICIGY